MLINICQKTWSDVRCCVFLFSKTQILVRRLIQFQSLLPHINIIPTSDSCSVNYVKSCLDMAQLCVEDKINYCFRDFGHSYLNLKSAIWLTIQADILNLLDGQWGLFWSPFTKVEKPSIVSQRHKVELLGNKTD